MLENLSAVPKTQILTTAEPTSDIKTAATIAEAFLTVDILTCNRKNTGFSNNIMSQLYPSAQPWQWDNEPVFIIPGPWNWSR